MNLNGGINNRFRVVMSFLSFNQFYLGDYICSINRKLFATTLTCFPVNIHLQRTGLCIFLRLFNYYKVLNRERLGSF